MTTTIADPTEAAEVTTTIAHHTEAAAFSLARSDEVEHQQATATHIRAADAGYE